MNSNRGKGSSGSLNNFNFDLGVGTDRPKSLNDQKNKPFSAYSSSTQPKPSWQPNKPSWSHQPSTPGLNGPTSMAGDIFGKSWSSAGTGSGSGIGIAEKNPQLFGDLFSSALGQENKGNSNVPLKKVTPTPNQGAYSMGNLADSLPKTNSSAKTGGSWGSSSASGAYSGGYNKSGSNVNANVNSKGPNLGVPPMKVMNGGGTVGSMSGNKDPFGSLFDFGLKQQSGSLNSASKDQKSNAGDDGFGSFQNASKSSTPTFPSGGFGGNKSGSSGSNIGSNSSLDDFGKAFPSQKQPPIQNSSDDPLDMFSTFTSGATATPSGGTGGQQFSQVDDPLDMFSTFTSGATATPSGGTGGQQFSQVDDWGLDSEFGGAENDEGGTTVELEGLPPPPAGVTASSAKTKGMDHQKQGQYADAIKWLSWAILLLEKTGDSASSLEVLSCRASCYKEVGEYKKAVADCSKVLEHDDANVSVLVQRALLYESMEKYKLGAEDLRAVLKIDPVNRIARSTVHRLTQMGG